MRVLNMRVQVAEVRQVLPVLLGAVRRPQVQHHHQTQDAVLRHQPHPAVHRHLFRHAHGLLPAGRVRSAARDVVETVDAP